MARRWTPSLLPLTSKSPPRLSGRDGLCLREDGSITIPQAERLREAFGRRPPRIARERVGTQRIRDRPHTLSIGEAT